MKGTERGDSKISASCQKIQEYSCISLSPSLSSPVICHSLALWSWEADLYANPASPFFSHWKKVLFLQLCALVTFSHCCDKIPGKSNLRKGLLWLLVLEHTAPCDVGGSESAHHVSSAVWKQRVMNTDAQLPSSIYPFLFRPYTHTHTFLKWYYSYPQAGWVCPLQLGRWKYPHRHAQRHISWVSRNPVKLTMKLTTTL